MKYRIVALVLLGVALCVGSVSAQPQPQRGTSVLGVVGPTVGPTRESHVEFKPEVQAKRERPNVDWNAITPQRAIIMTPNPEWVQQSRNPRPNLNGPQQQPGR